MQQTATKTLETRRTRSADEIALDYYRSRSQDLEERHRELVQQHNALDAQEYEAMKATIEPHNKAVQAYLDAYKRAVEWATIKHTLLHLLDTGYIIEIALFLPFHYLYVTKGIGLAIVLKFFLGIILASRVWHGIEDGLEFLREKRRSVGPVKLTTVQEAMASLFSIPFNVGLVFASLPIDARVALATGIVLTHGLVAGTALYRRLRIMPAPPSDGGTPFASRWICEWDREDKEWYVSRIDQPRVLREKFSPDRAYFGQYPVEQAFLEVINAIGTPLFFYAPQQKKAKQVYFQSEAFTKVFPYLEKQIRKRNKVFLEYAQTAYKHYNVIREQKRLATELQSIETQVEHMIERANVWKGVFLPEETVRNLLASLDLFVKGDPATPSGLLLYGPPGTGKTTIARKIAESGACNFIATGASQLKSGYVGGTEENVRKLWQEARSKTPCIIFVDECEEALASRTAPNIDQATRALVNSFLAEWQGFNPTQGVWVIGATNHPSGIDPAIMSRFGRSEEIPLPNADLRRGILENEIAKMGMSLGVTQEMVDATAGMSGRDIGTFVASIRRRASLDNMEDRPGQKHIEAAMRELRGRSSVRVSEEATWDNLVLNEKLKTELKTIARMLRDAEALQRRGIDLPSGILLYGPPGTGKTTIARVLANESGLHFDAPTLAQLKAGYEGQTAQQVRDIFERARANSPAILYLDEIDTIVPRRGSRSSSGFTDDLVSQLLQEMDGVRSDSRPVFIIASTNRLDQLDDAIVSRFSRKVEIGLPDAKGRAQIMRTLLRKKPVAFDADAFADRFALRTEGWSPRDLREAVKRAEMRATTRKYVHEADEEVTLREEDFEEDDGFSSSLSTRFID